MKFRLFDGNYNQTREIVWDRFEREAHFFRPPSEWNSRRQEALLQGMAWYSCGIPIFCFVFSLFICGYDFFRCNPPLKCLYRPPMQSEVSELIRLSPEVS
jgi:hypothetical protein